LTSAINTSGQSNLTKRLHHRLTWTVQSYLLCGSNTHSHLTHASLGPPKSTPQMASRSVSRFCTAHGRRSLYFIMGRPISPSKLPLRMGASEPPSNTWFLGPTRVHNPNGTSIASAVFAGLMIMYLGCLPINNRLYLRSNVMLAKSYMQVTMMAI